MLDPTNHIWINRRLSLRFGRFVSRCLSHPRHWLTQVTVYTFTGPSSKHSTLIRGDVTLTGSSPCVIHMDLRLTRRVHLIFLLFYARQVRTTARTEPSSRSLQGY